MPAVAIARQKCRVGIGFKREEFTGFGLSCKLRGARTDQSLDIVRRALAGETVTFKSDFSISRTLG
jgi:alkanesulfonate monooxygenase SsuD/methylene tetrahydromethanopterin reductase-like flavin-dependent oxidoreductase (luciferase family)